MFPMMMRQEFIDEEFVRAAAMHIAAGGATPKAALKKAIALQSEFAKWRDDKAIKERAEKERQKLRFEKERDVRLRKECKKRVEEILYLRKKKAWARAAHMKQTYTDRLHETKNLLRNEIHQICGEVRGAVFGSDEGKHDCIVDPTSDHVIEMVSGLQKE